MRDARAEVRFVWVRVVIVGVIWAEVSSEEEGGRVIVIREPRGGESSFEGRAKDVVSEVSVVVVSIMSCQTLTVRWSAAESGMPFQSMCLLVFSTIHVRTRRLGQASAISSSERLPAEQMRPSA